MDNSLLLCRESVTGLDEEEEMDEFDSVVEMGDDQVYLRVLLDKEVISSECEMRDFLKSCCNGLIGRARLDGINYILNVRALLGFKFHTAYLSVTYLDRFLAKRSIDAEKTWPIRLLSIACLSLAAKMEECVVPGLPEFCNEDYSFESNVIQRMELLVLNTLEWKMGSISPFAFTHFFVKKLRENLPHPRNELSRIFELILSAARDVKILCHRPSVIAAAATLVVLDQELTRNELERKIGLLDSNLDLGNEDLVSCYYQLQQMKSGIKSPDLSPLQSQRMDAFGNGSSSVTSIGGDNSSTKRKRLDFNQNDDNEPEKKHCHFTFR